MNPRKRPLLCTNCKINECKTNAKRFCSLQCAQDYRFKLRLHIFLSGQYPPLTSNARFMRRVLVYLHGEKCAQCGWAERHPLTNNVPVEVQHIDGNWENNNPANLMLLCPNCHSLTSTFRALNRGKGRKHRIGGRANRINPSDTTMRELAIATHKELLKRAMREIGEVRSIPDVQ